MVLVGEHIESKPELCEFGKQRAGIAIEPVVVVRRNEILYQDDGEKEHRGPDHQAYIFRVLP